MTNTDQFLQSSVATHLRCGGIFGDSGPIITCFLPILKVKEISKLVNI